MESALNENDHPKLEIEAKALLHLLCYMVCLYAVAITIPSGEGITKYHYYDGDSSACSPRALWHLYGKVGNNCERISDSGIHIYEPSLVTYCKAVL